MPAIWYMYLAELIAGLPSTSSAENGSNPLLMVILLMYRALASGSKFCKSSSDVDLRQLCTKMAAYVNDIIFNVTWSHDEKGL